MRYDVSMIIQEYTRCTLYESIVDGDVSLPVNFNKAAEFGIYDCGGGRFSGFELDKNLAPLEKKWEQSTALKQTSDQRRNCSHVVELVVRSRTARCETPAI